ncbi:MULTISPECIES: DUF3667 domain-containing protein [unclassified Leeuwenhoekiella]|uniref:DUF3667 domain-containing protein n=1 Tax=unclassified Leeuwenhoekiella TaxID=2615029 RepID=UPI000C367D3C|nr:MULTISPECIES: DUF3667 domain-containing protein [unclassified Leeuwenhoekiella]MAW95257.1 hypothetical protein [Leeuwenhoekiella sp.]MBA81820.1 hypothetical protein [Leeuwenhoekiella sp.]|tara:strand:- start:2007 stop:2813 length:807 start_codon:yes stop_codon:yes gene_type:complete
MAEIHTCLNCGSKFTENFCSKCGQKKVSEADYGLRSLLGQAFEAFTNLDSKFLKTFRVLVLNPGRLSLKFTSGVRAPYLKPFQVFLLCNVFFFIFLSETDIFRSPSVWFFKGNVDFLGIRVMDLVNTLIEKNEWDLKEVKIRYDRLSTDLSKSLLVLLIPFIALIGILFNRRMAFGKHLVFATHYFSALLLAMTLWYLIASNLLSPNRWFYLVPIFLAATLYYLISVRTFYAKKWWVSCCYGILGTLCMVMLISFYRTFINLLTFQLL